MKLYDYYGEKIAFRSDEYVKNKGIYVGMDYEDAECGGAMLPYADLTVALVNEKYPEKDCAYLNIPEMDRYTDHNTLKWLIEQGLVEKPETPRIPGSSGFCMYAYPYVHFTKKFFEEALCLK